MHTPGGARARQFAPQHRREVEPDQIVQRAAGEVSIHQGLVNLTRVFHRVCDGIFGDGIENHARHRHIFQDALGLEHLQNMPRNGLAFAVRVGCQNQAVGAFNGLGDVGHALGGFGINLP